MGQWIEHTDQGGVEAFLTTATNWAAPQIEMSVSWHQAPSPLYPAQANLKREKERARGNKKRTAGEWRRLGVGKGMWTEMCVEVCGFGGGSLLEDRNGSSRTILPDLSERHCGLRIRSRFSPPAEIIIFFTSSFSLCAYYSRQVLGHILGACRCFG